MFSLFQLPEAVHLMGHGVSPYDGDTFHEAPLLLYFYRWLLINWSHLIPKMFLVADVLTAILLSRSCSQQLADTIDWESEAIDSLEDENLRRKLTIHQSRISDLSSAAGISYLLLPYTILSCVGLSTSTLNNFTIAFIIYTATKNLRIISMASAAFYAHTSMYGVVLVVPAILTIEHQRSRHPKTRKIYSNQLFGCSFHKISHSLGCNILDIPRSIHFPVELVG